MKAQHHLADWAAVHEDQRRSGLGPACGDEQLAVDVEAIFTLEHYLLRCDELFRWKVRRQSLGRDHLAALSRDAVRHRRNGCA